MDKKLYLIGNFKMNMNMASIKPYLEDLKKVADNTDNAVGICVPYVYLPYVSETLKDSKALYGVQNMHFKDSGAYTGEVSADMLLDFATKLVVIGHSERREYYNETDEAVNLKVKKCLEKGLTPIVCFGEKLEEREAGTYKELIERQVSAALEGIEEESIKDIIFAYEPVWAIGTGKTATSDEAEDAIYYAKSIISAKYGKQIKSIMLYGGSLKPSNANELLSKPSIDGGLIGGACLKMEDFESIIAN